ncbi:hypothetical protein [Propionivibrio sp.]|uniref:hypothetical protein n=1 Tax=Propionivibrio sp. TaxID=2212460 RepID=UPI003BF0112A
MWFSLWLSVKAAFSQAFAFATSNSVFLLALSAQQSSPQAGLEANKDGLLRGIPLTAKGTADEAAITAQS